MLKIRTVIATFLTIMLFSIAFPVLAVSHFGGEWSYGGHHHPHNWGAFSNYYHGSSWHWSYVGSRERLNQRTATSGARGTSYAFINTNFSEPVVFDAGL